MGELKHLKEIAVRQWLPFIGIYYALKSREEEKPSMCESRYPIMYYGSAMYHAMWVIILICIMLVPILG